MLQDAKKMIKDGFDEAELASELGLSNTAVHTVFEIAGNQVDVASQKRVSTYESANYRSLEQKKRSVDYQKDDLVGAGKYTRPVLIDDAGLGRHPLDSIIGPTIPLCLGRSGFGAYRCGFTFSDPSHSNVNCIPKYKAAKINA